MHEFWAEVEALAMTACPPVALFEQGRSWLSVGRDLRGVYARVFREALDVDEAVSEADFARAETATQRFLDNWPAEKRGCLLLGAATHLYSQGPEVHPEPSRGNSEPVRDQLLWQLGQEIQAGKRERSVAQDFIQALRDIGLLGQPVWLFGEAKLLWQMVPEQACPGVPVTFNGTWFNYYRVQQPEVKRMSQVAPAIRQQVKAKVKQLAATTFTGMRLTVRRQESGRAVAYTEHGHLFGYVKQTHEEMACRQEAWRIAWATAVDGNVNAILVAADADCAETQSLP
jgi:hypothetical protein